MDTPSSPPYGDLIELARKGGGFSIAQAARTARIAKQTWMDVVSGHTASPKPETLARMAHAVGVTPERLEAEGQRPDAAEILKEIMRGESPPPPLPAEPPSAAEEAARLYPDDAIAQAIWRHPLYSEAEKRALLDTVQAKRLELLERRPRAAG